MKRGVSPWLFGSKSEWCFREALVLRYVRTAVQALRGLPEVRLQIGAVVVKAGFANRVIYSLAELFVEDVLADLGRDVDDPKKAKHKAELTQRAAEAMQQAIEDECDAIRKELQG